MTETNEKLENDSSTEDDSPGKNIYRECCIFDENECGPYRIEKITHDGMVTADALTGPIDKHLRNLQFRNLKLFAEWTEKLLIENRLGRCLQSDEKLCPYHRLTLGVYAQIKTQCCHGDHPKVKRGQKAAKTSRISLQTLQKLNSSNNYAYKVGAFLCKKHAAMVSKSLKAECGNEEEDEESNFETTMDEDDFEYTPPVFIINDESVEQTSQTAAQVAINLEVSPISHKIRKSVDDLNERDLRYFKKKKTEWMVAAE